MFARIRNWIHHILDSHCVKCEDQKICKNCETLREFIAEERYQKKEILEELLNQVNPARSVTNIPISEKKPEAIHRTGHLPFRVRREMMEKSSARELEILQNKARQDAEDAGKLPKVPTVDELESIIGAQSNG